MTITLELPDDIATHANPGREALEALAIEGYRCERLTHHEAATLLGMTRFEFEAFLKDRGVMDQAYDVEDLRHDLLVMDRMDRAGLIGR